MNKLTLTLLSLCLLSACGGGDDSTSATPQPSPDINPPTAAPSEPDPTPTPSPEPEPEPEPSEQSMTDLVINPKFDLSTKFSLVVDVDIPLDGQRAYLNICQKLPEQDKADRSNCILRTPLNGDPLNTILTISRSDMPLIAEIWSYNNDTVPLTYQWQFDANLEQQKFEMK